MNLCPVVVQANTNTVDACDAQQRRQTMHLAHFRVREPLIHTQFTANCSDLHRHSFGTRPHDEVELASPNRDISINHNQPSPPKNHSRHPLTKLTYLLAVVHRNPNTTQVRQV
jgi:hypothetical protein